ncbi:MAG: hypothetical protein P9L94_07575 [Candidatus Hinthialibacter antarcticus]|nr:hypothetical protein [Candidatus Hinthialibacter antarcticus]
MSSIFYAQGQNAVLPSIPNALVERAQDEGRPMLLAGRELRRKTERRLRRGLEERGDEFFLRVDGFLLPQSPWYVGEGPFQENDDFHPKWLNEPEFMLYSKLVTELNAYLYLERERWALQAAKLEFARLLNELETADAVDSFGMARPAFTKRDGMMLALTTLLYDQSYFRLDTKDRHQPNQRIKALRDRLAMYCRTLDVDSIPPQDALAFGSGLGLSTLFCISIYPLEWGNERDAASMLPDLYAAANLTQHGLARLIEEDGRFACSMPQIENALLTAIPWTQTMTRLGYPYAAAPGTFTRIASALEAHRLPGSSDTLATQKAQAMTSPWVPFTHPLFPAPNPALYNKEDLRSATAQMRARKSPAAALAQMPISLRQRDLNITRSGSRMTLKDQLEMFGLPRPAEREPQAVTPTQPAPVQRDAGWRLEAYPEMPGPWGAVYHLAAKESNSAELVERWAELGGDSDNHPYTFYYTFPVAASNSPPLSLEPVLMKYPESNLSIFSMQKPREQHLLAIQSATDTIVASTLQVAHESFLLYEGGLQFRWFHDLYGATAAVQSVSGTTQVCASFDYSAEPLLTSLYSAWQQDSPAGRTISVRRHEGTVGSAYNIVAHFPLQASPVVGTRNIVVSIPPKADTLLGDMNEWINIDVKGDELSDEIHGLRDWQAIRRLERRGTYKPKGFGMLHLLFSPNTLMLPHAAEGALGEILELELKTPVNPFFYIASLQQPGREKFEPKYASLPMPGLRVLEWHEGIEVIAVRQGELIDNPFIESDADLVVATRDSAMKAVFYLVVNGSYAKVKFSPQQRTPILLLNTKKQKLTAAWADRKVHVTTPPRSGSIFYAPSAVSFVCPDSLIKFGRKKNQVVVNSVE